MSVSIASPLEAELKAAKEEKAGAKGEELPQYMSHIKRSAGEPEKPKPMPKYDPTEGMGMSGSAMKAMIGIVGEMKDRSKMDDTRRPSYPEPGGFGPPRSTGGKAVDRGSGWVEPRPLEPISGLKYIDQQIDVQDAIDRRDLKRRLGDGNK